MLSFIKAYIKSMRLYYFFVTGIAGWIGVVYYEYMNSTLTGNTIAGTSYSGKKIVILLLLFLSWGINQIINDFLGLKEDRINALLRLLEQFGIKEMVRTGRLAMVRGSVDAEREAEKSGNGSSA